MVFGIAHGHGQPAEEELGWMLGDRSVGLDFPGRPGAVQSFHAM